MSWFSRDAPREAPVGLTPSALPWIDDFRLWHREDEKSLGNKGEWGNYVVMCILVYSQLAKSLLEREGHPRGVERIDTLLNSSKDGTINIVFLLNFMSEHFTDQWRIDMAPHARKMLPMIASGSDSWTLRR